MASNIFGIKALHGSTTPHILGHSATPAGDIFELWSGATDSTQVLKVHKNGDLIMGPDSSPELATTATGGFLMIRSCNGAPTGDPANDQAGLAVLAYDRANHALYIHYGGTWRSVSVS